MSRADSADLPDVLETAWLPQLTDAERAGLAWTERHVGRGDGGGGARLRTPTATPELLAAVCDRLLAAQAEHLADRRVVDVVDALARALGRWQEPASPERRTAEALLPALTGYAPETVRRSLKDYLKTFRRGPAAALPGGGPPEPAGAGRVPAVGRRWADAGAAAAARLAGVRRQRSGGCRRGTWCARCSSGRRCSASRRAPSRCSPPCWRARSPRRTRASARASRCGRGRAGDEALEAPVLARAEAVTATGGLAAVRDLARRVPVGVPLVAYGHTLGVAVVGREALALTRYADTARRVARDVSHYDQQGCLSPHAVLVETGGAVDLATFAAALAAELERYERVRPRAPLSLAESAAVRRERTTAGAAVLGRPGRRAAREPRRGRVDRRRAGTARGGWCRRR